MSTADFKLTSKDFARMQRVLSSDLTPDEKAVWLAAYTTGLKREVIPFTEGGFRRATGYAGPVWTLDVLRSLESKGYVTTSLDGFVAAAGVRGQLPIEDERGPFWATLSTKEGLASLLATATEGFTVEQRDMATWTVGVGPEWTGLQDRVDVWLIDQRYHNPENRWLVATCGGQCFERRSLVTHPYLMAAKWALAVEGAQLCAVVSSPGKLAPTVLRIANAIGDTKRA